MHQSTGVCQGGSRDFETVKPRPVCGCWFMDKQKLTWVFQTVYIIKWQTQMEILPWATDPSKNQFMIKDWDTLTEQSVICSNRAVTKCNIKNLAQLFSMKIASAALYYTGNTSLREIYTNEMLLIVTSMNLNRNLNNC